MTELQSLSLGTVLLCLIALWFLSPRFRWGLRGLVMGPPNLEISELPAIWSEQQNFKIDRNPGKKLPGADKSLRAYTEKVSIIYHQTRNARGFNETVDISYPGKCGMIFTLVNGEVVVFERIGGRTRDVPIFSTDEQKNSMSRFMTELRKFFSKV